MRDAHRYRAVVVEMYVPYCPSGRNNALCVVRDAHRCCAVVCCDSTPFVPKQKYATDAAASPNSGDASKKTPKACATLKSRLKTYQRCLEHKLQVGSIVEAGTLVSIDPTEQTQDTMRCLRYRKLKMMLKGAA